MEQIDDLDDSRFFPLCAAFRRVTADDIAHLLDDGAIRDLLSLVRRYGDAMRGGGAVIDYTGFEGAPGVQERRCAAHLARMLGIDPADPAIVPTPEIVYIDPNEFGLFDHMESKS